MSTIQGVLVDFGGVIYRTPDMARMQRWFRLLSRGDLSVFNMLSASPRESQYVRDLWTGQVSEQKAWEDVARTMKMRPSVLRFMRRRGLAPRNLNKALVAQVASLRGRLPTGILTNAGTDFRSTFCAAFQLDKLVDQVIISAEVGLCKPDPEIYHLAAQRLGLPLDQVLFIDDMPENVEGAQSVGMQSFLFTTEEEVVQKIKQYLQR